MADFGDDLFSVFEENNDCTENIEVRTVVQNDKPTIIPKTEVQNLETE